jgi:hypothetical protein
VYHEGIGRWKKKGKEEKVDKEKREKDGRMKIFS